MRIALGIEYDGRCYAGWQRQQNHISIQSCLEEALSQVAATPIAVHCAGRTDAGVHALMQVVHFETDIERPIDAWMLGANTHLPRDIAVRWSKQVDDEFHARFSATARRYRYVIDNRRVRSALLNQRVTWHYAPLNAELMHEAAQYLLGEQDFSSLRASDCQSSTPMRCVHEVVVKRQGDFVILEVEANAFLHHMVRNIVGLLLPIGEGLHPPSHVKEVLAACDRSAAGVTARSDGLYFIAVRYPECFGLPISANETTLGHCVI